MPNDQLATGACSAKDADIVRLHAGIRPVVVTIRRLAEGVRILLPDGKRLAASIGDWEL